MGSSNLQPYLNDGKIDPALLRMLFKGALDVIKCERCIEYGITCVGEINPVDCLIKKTDGLKRLLGEIWTTYRSLSL